MSYIGNSPGVASQRVETAFTATSNQTAFTPSSGYTLGYCDVYQNGVKLVNGDDYTASDGVTVTLATGAASGDSIVIVASFPRGLSDGYLKSEADAKYLTIANPSYTGTLTGGTGAITIGTNHFVKDSSGNIGIGVASPSFQLDLGNGTSVSTRLRLQRGSDDPNQYMTLGWNSINVHRASTALSSAQTDIYFNQVGSNGTRTVMYIDTSGRLAVGGTSKFSNAINAFGATQGVDSGGNIFAGATESFAADKGGQIMMGGKYRSAGDYCSFGGFAAKKENGTDGNYAGYLQFLVSNYTLGNVERARIDSSGNFGIGTISPQNLFHVSTASASNSKFEQTGAGANYLTLRSNSADRAFIGLENSSGSGLFGSGSAYGLSIGTPGATDFAFATNNAIRGRFDSGGRFLVGVSTPSHSTFQFESGGSGAKIGTVSLGRSGGDYPWIGFNFAFTGSSGNYVYAGGDYASSIYFYVGGIYTYTASSGTAGNAISWTGGPYVARGGTSWTNASDERLKNITGDIENGLAKVCALRAATYTWKHDDQNTPQVGLIAQNVLTVVPEAVVVPEEEFNGKPETSMGVNYDRLIPVLVAAIKEQQAIIEQLQADVATLKGTP